jgi:prepilin-type N-terminal cleavage/methylation domain-containing protein
MKLRRGFTLIEMLVVIAIIAIVISLVFPAISRAMNSAKTTGSVNNLRSIHHMFTLYLMDNNQQFMKPYVDRDPDQGIYESMDWPRALWEHVHGDFEGNVVEAMQNSSYSRTMWCPVQVAKNGQEQHPRGRTSYGMNRYFQQRTRFSDHPDTEGVLEPLLVGGTNLASNPKFGTQPMNLSSSFPYETAWQNVAYIYGGNRKSAVALWIAGNAGVVPHERMVGLDSDMKNGSDFR